MADAAPWIPEQPFMTEADFRSVAVSRPSSDPTFVGAQQPFIVNLSRSMALFRRSVESKDVNGVKYAVVGAWEGLVSNLKHQEDHFWMSFSSGGKKATKVTSTVTAEELQQTASLAGAPAFLAKVIELMYNGFCEGVGVERQFRVVEWGRYFQTRKWNWLINALMHEPQAIGP